MSEQLLALISMLGGTLIGVALTCAWFRTKQKQTEPPAKTVCPQVSSPQEPSLDEAKNDSVRYVETQLAQLLSLAAQMNSQVGTHTAKIGEITESLNQPADVGSAMVLVAGQMLIAANQKLQKDLDDSRREIDKQREEMQTCMRESMTDPLTGLFNRRGLEHELTRVFAQHKRDGSFFSVLMIDIDHFKRINDRYGHMVGDQVLKGFAKCLVNTFRDSDVVARFGGEEFVAILPSIHLDDAFRAAERIRQKISKAVFHAGDLELQLTACIGVDEITDAVHESELLEQADAALYAAKNSGRNRSCYCVGEEFKFELVTTELSVHEATLPLSLPDNTVVPASA